MGKKLERFCYTSESKGVADLGNESFCAVAKGAFERDTTANFVKLPPSVETLECESFKECENLEIVEIPSKGLPTSAPTELFYCSKAEEPKAEEQKGKELYIESHAFCNCRKLHTITIEKYAAVIIDNEAFDGCDSLRNVIIDAGTAKIDDEAFSGLSGVVFVTNCDDVCRFARKHGYRCVDL